MNLTWHIVKKDLRALKWPLLLWVLVIVAKLGVGVMLLMAEGTEEVEWFARMDGLSKVLAAFEGVSFVLAAALIHQDLLVGTKSFWVTRPISGGRLLRAKLATLLLVFGLMPLLITLPWWLGCGYGLREIGWAALETASIHVVCVLIGLVWAVVTDGFGRFLMWTLVTLFAIPTLIGTLTYYLGRGGLRLSGAAMVERMIIGTTIAVVAILAVVVHQYLTRRTTRSIGMIAGGAGLIIAVGVFWPWHWHLESRVYSYLIRQAHGEWPAAAEPTGLKYMVESAQVTLYPTKRGGTAGGNVRVKYRVDGLTESQVIMPYWAEHTWRWADGTMEEGVTRSRSSFTEWASEHAVWRTIKINPAKQRTEVVTAIASVNHATGMRLQAEPPTYSLSARLRLMELDSVSPISQQSGPRDLSGVWGEAVAHVEKSADELHITFIRHSPSLWVDNIAGGSAPNGPFVQYLMVNRKRDYVDRGSSLDRKSTRIGTVDVTWYTMAYRASPKRTGSTALLEGINALNDAELLKVTFVEQARFTHVITADPLKIEPASP